MVIIIMIITINHRGVVVTTIVQLHSTKPEDRFCAYSNPAPSRHVGDLR